jgi:hypothetical protein
MICSSRFLIVPRLSFGRPLITVSQQQQRFLSSMVPNTNPSVDGGGSSGGDESLAGGGPPINKKQPFVTAKLEPGEWDAKRRDPYYRPTPPRNKLISAEDFANRPPVGFEGEFSSFEDSMIVLSWLDSKTCRQIYLLYTDMMLKTEQAYPGRTSHEYVCRVLAQKFQITPWRAAGVVQLQHNEEQMRRNHPELLCEEQAKYAEETILRNIRDAYRAEQATPPNQASGGSVDSSQPYVEDPVGIHGLGEPDETSSSWVATDDIYDLEAKLQRVNVRDEELARILIDEHVYKKDVDESTLDVKTDGAAKRLLKHAARVRSQQEDETRATEIPYPETNAQGVRRPRWKYVAKVVNTRAMRKKGRRITSYTNNNMENTIVEHEGTLRVATVAEAKQVAWRPTRTKSKEYLYEGVKKAWLERTIQGKTGVWGQAPKTSAAAATAQASALTSVLPEDVPEGTATSAAGDASVDEEDFSEAAADVDLEEEHDFDARSEELSSVVDKDENKDR